jgi:hypothetical protein
MSINQGALPPFRDFDVGAPPNDFPPAPLSNQGLVSKKLPVLYLRGRAAKPHALEDKELSYFFAAPYVG